jgi:hypothetical protein
VGEDYQEQIHNIIETWKNSEYEFCGFVFLVWGAGGCCMRTVVLALVLFFICHRLSIIGHF